MNQKLVKDPQFEQKHPRKNDGTFTFTHMPSSADVESFDKAEVTDVDATEKLFSDITSEYTSLFPSSDNTIPAHLKYASHLKYHVVSNLASATKLRKYWINNLIQSWAEGIDLDNDEVANHEELFVGSQVVASRLFGAPLTDYVRDLSLAYNQDENTFEEHRKIESALKTMYQRTQDVLSKHGIKEVVLYRGVKDTGADPSRENKVEKIISNPLSSWSYNYTLAREFAYAHGVVYKARFPVERILSIPHTGFGCLREGEFVVIGGIDEVKVVFSRKQNFSVYSNQKNKKL